MVQPCAQEGGTNDIRARPSAAHHFESSVPDIVVKNEIVVAWRGGVGLAFSDQHNRGYKRPLARQ